jgi:fatty-acyl-CoA synthase
MTYPFEWLDKNFADALDWASAEYAEREAIVHGNLRLSFAQLASQVRAFARGLVEQGVQPGDKVALWMPDCAEWLVARWAVPIIGAVLVPINTRFRDNDLRYVLEQSEAQVLIMQSGAREISYFEILARIVPDYRSQPNGAWHTQALPSLRLVIGLAQRAVSAGSAAAMLGGELPPSMVPFEAVQAKGAAVLHDGQLARRLAGVKGSDVAQILYTSGTTSFPKGAMVCHGPLLQNNYFAIERLRLNPTDRYLSVVPLFTATGTFYTLATWLAGATMVLTERFEPRSFCELVEREKITITFFVDTIVQDLKAFGERTRYDLSSLRTGTGAPLPTASFLWVTHELQVPQLVSAYGMSETSNAVVRSAWDESLEIRSTTNGRPMPGVRIRIADLATNESVPAGTVGEICVAGYVVMKGYYKQPEEDRKAFDAEGWLHTGDLGELNPSGHLIYRGRVKEMIKPGGFNVATQEIEVFLKTIPGVREAVVVGVPDARLGEVGYAFVEVQAGAQVDRAAALQFCRESIASYKVPRYIEFVNEWPRTGSAKIKKLELKARAAATLQAERSDA